MSSKIIPLSDNSSSTISNSNSNSSKNSNSSNSNNNNDVINIENDNISDMRISTGIYNNQAIIHNNETKEQRKQRIISKRIMLKWLPVYHTSDVLFGSYLFLYGSIIAIIIPLITLISYFIYMWEHHDYLSHVYGIAVYVLLVFMGVCYTVGSYIFCRVFYEPSISPVFGWKTRIMANDEVYNYYYNYYYYYNYH
jgi:hypothetical protein